jgi:hypothetical protein
MPLPPPPPPLDDDATDDGAGGAAAAADEEDGDACELGPVTGAPWGWCIRFDPVVDAASPYCSRPTLLFRAALLLLLPVDANDGWGILARGGLSRSLPEAEARLPLPRLAPSSSSHVCAPLGDDADGWIPCCCCGRCGDVGAAVAAAAAAAPPSPLLAADLPSVDELIGDSKMEFEARADQSKRKGFASTKRTGPHCTTKQSKRNPMVKNDTDR